MKFKFPTEKNIQKFVFAKVKSTTYLPMSEDVSDEIFGNTNKGDFLKILVFLIYVYSAIIVLFRIITYSEGETGNFSLFKIFSP